MLYGVLITMPDGSTFLGVIFPDNQLYAHEPIADTFSSQEDFTTSYPGYKVELIGPVVAIELARAQLLEQYEEGKRILNRDFNNAQKMYSMLEAGALPVGENVLIASQGAD